MTIRRSILTWRTSGASGVAAIFLLTGCVNLPTVSRTVYEDPTLLVRLDRPSTLKEASGEPDRHAAELTTQDLASILRSVMIQPEISFVSYWLLRKDPQPAPAFPNDDADLLAAHFADALAEARPHETAVFFLRRVRKDGIPLVTTGALAVRGDQLVLFLANVCRPTTTQRKLAAAREAPLGLVGDPDFHFVAGPNQTVLTSKDLPDAVAMARVPALSINQRAWRVRASPSPTAPEIPGTMADEKLRQLKTWHEQSLITDDEYRQKRQEILKRF